jgi:hypothetical protein
MKKMTWIGIGLVLLVLAGFYIWNESKKKQLVSKEPIVHKICEALPGFTVRIHKNDIGEVGGYVAYTMEAVGARTYYYESGGNEFAAASAVEKLQNRELADRIAKWNVEIKEKYPHERIVECGR